MEPDVIELLDHARDALDELRRKFELLEQRIRRDSRIPPAVGIRKERSQILTGLHDLKLLVMDKLADDDWSCEELAADLEQPMKLMVGVMDELLELGLVRNILHLGESAVYERVTVQNGRTLLSNVARNERIKRLIMREPLYQREIIELLRLEPKVVDVAIVEIRRTEPVWNKLKYRVGNGRGHRYYLPPDREVPPPEQDLRMSGSRWTQEELDEYRKRRR